MKYLSTLVVLALLASTQPSLAQNQTDAHAAHHPDVATATPMADLTNGEVRKIDKAARKLTLKHGPIKNLDMPGMTMVFQVKDATLLDQLAVGDKIVFTAEEQQGAYVVTAVNKVSAP